MNPLFPREYFVEYSEKFKDFAFFLNLEGIKYDISDADIIWFKLESHNDTAFANLINDYFSWKRINELYNPKNK